MTADLDLARRAVACKGFRWMPGMLVVSSAWLHSARYLRTVDHGNCIEHEWSFAWNGGDGGRMPDDAAPDLFDPATLGCLLDLVREAWGNPGIFVRPHRDGWQVHEFAGRRILPFGEGNTEPAALVAALEAAP